MTLVVPAQGRLLDCPLVKRFPHPQTRTLVFSAIGCETDGWGMECLKISVLQDLRLFAR